MIQIYETKFDPKKGIFWKNSKTFGKSRLWRRFVPRKMTWPTRVVVVDFYDESTLHFIIVRQGDTENWIQTSFSDQQASDLFYSVSKTFRSRQIRWIIKKILMLRKKEKM